MLRRILQVFVPAAFCVLLGIPAVYAQRGPQQSPPARFIHHVQARSVNLVAPPPPAEGKVSPAPQHSPGRAARAYPQFDAALYPVPRQDIPMQVGGTVLTNQVIAPIELLHAHEYRALYGPYFYRVKGGWFLTPTGIQSHEKWELLGTKVRVKYRTKFGLLSRFIPPLVN